MNKGFLVALVISLVVVTSAVDWDDVPDDDTFLHKRRECRDKYSKCGDYSRYCRSSAQMRKLCPKTCRNCGKTKIRLCTKQERPICQKWRRRGFCKTKIYYRYMRLNCPGACGFCRLIEKPGTKKPVKSGAHPVSVDVQECLRVHNVYRARHGAPPLRWDPKRARKAQAFALKLAKVKTIYHARNISDGENLAMQRTWGTSRRYTCAQATKAWYDEVKDYSFTTPGFSMKTGHFTQVVWKSSKLLGVGIAKNGGFTVVVARYSPPGNYRGQFRENVGERH